MVGSFHTLFRTNAHMLIEIEMAALKRALQIYGYRCQIEWKVIDTVSKKETNTLLQTVVLERYFYNQVNSCSYR